MVDSSNNKENEIIENFFKIKLGDENYDEELQKAEKFKVEGNNFLKENKFMQAVDSFTKAVDMKVETLNNAIYLSNRAFIHIKMENFGLALADANKAIEIDSNYLKAYYRRASAHLFLRKYDEALKDLNYVKSHIKEENSDLDEKIKQTISERKKQRFLDSIKSDHSISIQEEGDIFYKTLNFYDKNPTQPKSKLTYKSDNAIPNEKQVKLNKTPVEPEIKHNIDIEWVKSLTEEMKSNVFIDKVSLTQMIYDAKILFDSQNTLTDITVDEENDITICGDTHGQFYDLLNIFKINGYPEPKNMYLFNGDFVDRGSFSVEIVITLIALKILYPKHFFMSRGNHESKNLNKLYGFEGEVRSKYDDKMYELFSILFCSLPLCHVVNKKIFVVHGGLFSKDGVTLDDIRAIDRHREPAESGLMCECLWSDPCKELGRQPSKRGVGLSFGPDITKKFLELNNLEMIIRSHEVKQEGYEIDHDGKLVTLFSAPNYCDQMGNKGALVRYNGKEMKPKYVQFTHVDHPKVPAMKFANPWMMF